MPMAPPPGRKVPIRLSSLRSRSRFSTKVCPGLTLRTKPSRMASESGPSRSEEHTSELQSQSNLVCRLLLEKKKLHSLLYDVRRAVARAVVCDEQMRGRGRLFADGAKRLRDEARLCVRWHDDRDARRRFGS